MTAATTSSWVADHYGIEVADEPAGPWSIGPTTTDLTRIALRRNPKRAQLLVSTVLGKHLPVDPRVVCGTGRLLGALVARRLAGESAPPPRAWAVAAAATVRGADPGQLLAALPDPAPRPGVLTFGFAETATSLGHLVADQLGAPYLHSTRRPDGPVPVTAEFVESHSHATDHRLRPDARLTLAGNGPLVLVDDELSTGRTALNVVEALHARFPRDRYVLAGLVDVRSPASDTVRAELAARLGCRIDVVSLVRGAVRVPDGSAERVSRDLAGSPPPDDGRGVGRPVAVREVPLPWPARLPPGGRHGFAVTDRPEFEVTLPGAAEVLATACDDAGRVLVLGTEELMYLPLRLALALQSPTRATAFQSTTRSPVHAIDAPGYPIRRRIDFTSAPYPGSPDRVERHVYHAGWPDAAGGGEADLIVVVDDGHAVPGRTGVAESVARATGTPVVLARLTAVAG